METHSTGTFTTLIAVMLIAGPAVSTASAAPPANDDFGDAAAIESLPFSATLDLSEATTEFQEPACGESAHTVWFRYDTGSDPEDVLAGYAEGPSEQVSVAVYTGVHRLALQRETCWSNDDFRRSLRFTSEPDTTYWIQVGTSEPVAELAFSFGGLGGISGTVTDEDTNAGLDDVCILLPSVAFSDEDGIFIESGEDQGWTEADGSYVIDDISPGPVYVLFYDCERDEGGDYGAEWYDDSPDITGAAVVEVPVGTTLSGIDAQMPLGDPYPLWDVNVVDVSVESTTDGPFVRPETITVTLVNHGPDDASFANLRVEACPRSGVAFCNLISFDHTDPIPAGATHIEEIPWDGEGGVGDMTITARAGSSDASTETSVLLPPGTGVGVNVER